jgi:hypothetical protein
MYYWWLFSIPVVIALCMLAILFKPEIWEYEDDNNFQQYIGQDGGDVLVTLQTLYPKHKTFEIIGPDEKTGKIIQKCGTSKKGSLQIHVSKTGKVRKIK